MRVSIAIFAASAGLVAAQTTAAGTGTISGVLAKDCDAANIVNTCIASTKGRIDACDSSDYECLCSAWQAQLTCWNNCPGNDGSTGAQSYVTSYCNIVSQSKSAESSKTKTSDGEQTDDGVATKTVDVDTQSTDDASSSSSSGLARAVAVPAAGSVFAIVLGIFGMM